MLVGVLVEVVATVMREDQTRNTETIVRGRMKELMETTTFDEDPDMAWSLVVLAARRNTHSEVQVATRLGLPNETANCCERRKGGALTGQMSQIVNKYSLQDIPTSWRAIEVEPLKKL